MKAVVVALAIFAIISVVIAYSDVTPTCYVMFFWGTASINGSPVQVGDIVRAYAPGVEVNNGCIGEFTVNYAGYYGAIAVYGDDPTTSEKDGADEGDTISFTITRNGTTYTASQTGTFHDKDFVQLNLTAQ